MDWMRELSSVGIPTDCNNCIIKGCSCADGYCGKFHPARSDKILEDVVWKLDNTIDKSKDNKLKRHAVADKRFGATYDDKDTLDSYYVQFINDTLSVIRAGRIAYIFHLYQARDLIRFEDIKLKYNVDADCFEVKAV